MCRRADQVCIRRRLTLSPQRHQLYYSWELSRFDSIVLLYLLRPSTAHSENTKARSTSELFAKFPSTKWKICDRRKLILAKLLFLMHFQLNFTRRATEHFHVHESIRKRTSAADFNLIRNFNISFICSNFLVTLQGADWMWRRRIPNHDKMVFWEFR